jgi:hypothetical protein
MYRRAEFGLFTALSWTAVTFAFLSLAAVGFYYYSDSLFFRNLAVVFIFFSFFFKVQIFMYKVTILEKRMLYVVGLSEQHFRIAQKKENLFLLLYFALFWAAMMGVIFSFTPSPR